MSGKEGHNLVHSNQIQLQAATKLSLVLDLDHTLVHATNDVEAAKPHLLLSSSSSMSSLSKHDKDDHNKININNKKKKWKYQLHYDVHTLILPVIFPANMIAAEGVNRKCCKTLSRLLVWLL